MFVASGHPAVHEDIITCSDDPPRFSSYFTLEVPLQRTEHLPLEHPEKCFQVCANHQCVHFAFQSAEGRLFGCSTHSKHALFCVRMVSRQVTCDGVAVRGEYNVRVDKEKLLFTFYPDRESNPLKPGQYCDSNMQPVADPCEY